MELWVVVSVVIAFVLGVAICYPLAWSAGASAAAYASQKKEWAEKMKDFMGGQNGN